MPPRCECWSSSRRCRCRSGSDLALAQLLPGDVLWSHGRDPGRAEKLDAFLRGQAKVFVATSILERGVTVPDVDVIVLYADAERIFQEPALIQMAGRVGRTAARPGGRVAFVGRRVTPVMRQAVAHIESMNEEAAALGLLRIESSGVQAAFPRRPGARRRLCGSGRGRRPIMWSKEHFEAGSGRRGVARPRKAAAALRRIGRRLVTTLFPGTPPCPACHRRRPHDGADLCPECSAEDPVDRTSSVSAMRAAAAANGRRPRRTTP